MKKQNFKFRIYSFLANLFIKAGLYLEAVGSELDYKAAYHYQEEPEEDIVASRCLEITKGNNLAAWGPHPDPDKALFI